ncbi:hypothetical protein PQE68_gp018 [Bacillus phage vB_BanS_Sophrita]|uniref:Uncharacterized protein n=2 Tax=Sophritavirus TaxID=3044834 RepID=A0A3Q9R7N4_9CAUD|nr:hypothetical protein PQE68_gp018 [Bacillus phage vB_BanS_Sophrita]YP_010680093.1 hypothetical protein PQE69_gp139 [Bacillus phage pW2]AZU98979.1 hypothetical protein pW2_153 [Bacillus phage pW2]UGO50609.1 hypothetical protein SOPHRITA_18 [Bacillus phage vB_BanS_Sophrita]
MYNEVMHKKYVNSVMKRGVSKYMAQEIVETAIRTGKGKNVEQYISYAMTLVYGLKYSV